MCIICIKPAGVDLPSDDEIKYMFNRNPHGAGFALQGDIHGDGRFIVEYHKGFMNVDDLIEALGPREKLKNLTVVIHCRIKTSGETDKFTTHPFPISNQYCELRKLDGRGPVLFHNGVFSGLGGIINEKASDTQDFVVGVACRYLAKPVMPGKISQAIVKEIAGDCRVLVLYENKNFPMLKMGTWHEHNGCLYSNTGFKTETTYSSSYSSGYYGYGYGYGSHYKYDDKKDSTIDDDDSEYELLENGAIYLEDGYIWFEDDYVLLEWMDQAEKISDYIYKYHGERWYVDVINCEAYTDEGLRTYFNKNEVGHVRKQLKRTGAYIEHSSSVKFDSDDEELEKVTKAEEKESE